MKITPTDIDNFSKTAAAEFLARGTSLNDSIVKIASENGLNSEQIKRVVESANSEVYLTMFNKTASKYIQFENADSEAIVSKLFPTSSISKAAGLVSDYNAEPSSELIEDDARPIFSITETVLHPSPDALYREYTKVASVNATMENSLEELELQFSTDGDVLFNMIKQAVLGGTNYGDIHYAITSVHNDRIIDATMNDIESRLSKEMPLRKFEKTAEIKNTVNANHPIMKQAAKIVKTAEEFMKIKAKQNELASEWEHTKQASVPPTKQSAKLLKALGAPLRNPGTFAAGAIAGGIAVPVLMSAANKGRSRRENSPLNNIPPGYQR